MEKQKRIIKPKTRGNGTLTEAQFWAKIRNALRNAFRWWKPMEIALKKASRPSQKINSRIKIEYQCAHCLKWFKRQDVEIDHIIPCGSLNCIEDISMFVNNLTSENTNDYQILCKLDCHRKKTLKENTERRELKKLKK